MCRKHLQDCKSGKEFLQYAEVHGASIRPAAGSHWIVMTDNGQCVVPVHNNEQLGKGLWCKIVKTFIAIGLGGFIWWIVVNPDILLQWINAL